LSVFLGSRCVLLSGRRTSATARSSCARGTKCRCGPRRPEQRPGVVAAICWTNLEARWPGMRREAGREPVQAAFNIVSPGTADRPTPVEMVDAVFAHIVVHRWAAGSSAVQPHEIGRRRCARAGAGKTELLRRTMACFGPSVVDVVNDYERHREDGPVHGQGPRDAADARGRHRRPGESFSRAPPRRRRRRRRTRRA
jgi:hypothetical protein